MARKVRHVLPLCLFMFVCQWCALIVSVCVFLFTILDYWAAGLSGDVRKSLLDSMS